MPRRLPEYIVKSGPPYPGQFKTFKINIAHEVKVNKATSIDVAAFKLFNKSQERTLTSCYREVAHAKEGRILDLEDLVIDLGGDIRKAKKEKTNGR